MSIKILLVDDESSLLEQAKIFLERAEENLDVDITTSANEALEMLDNDEFDIIVSDYKMPERDGIEFLKVLREERDDNIPFIMITGKGKEEIAMKALNLGADQYLQKVVEPKPWYNILAKTINEEVKQFESEKRILESEERYRRLFESAQDGILILDAETGKIEDVNPYLKDLLGYSEEELVGKEFWKIDTFMKIAGTRDEFIELLDEDQKYYKDIPLATITGKDIPVEIEINTYHAGGKKLVRFNIIDISDKKHKESLQEAVMRFRKLSEASPNAIILVDKNTGTIKDVNQVAEELLDMKRKNIIGKEYLDLHPKEEKKEIKAILYRDERSESRYSNELHVKDSDQKEIPVKMRTSSLVLGDEEIIYFVLNDISKRREAEEREEFLHSLLRHDLRNKIHISKGNLDLLKESGLPEEKIEFLDDALESLNEGIDIIEKVRNLKKIGKDEVKDVLIGGGILRRAVDQYRSEAKSKGMKIELNLNDVTEKVKGGELLPEVFSNLISNSIRHSYGDKIVVSVGEDEDEVICTVEDDGMGIPSEKKDKIFEKGFTTVNSSSGLGLYLVKDIISNYGGRIEVKDSELGGGRWDVRLQKV